MKLEEIQNHWAKDSVIDRTELGDESIKIPQLHSKYFKMYSEERLRLKSMMQGYKVLYRVLVEYYNGTLSEEEMEEYGLEPNPLKILKNEINIHIEANEQIQQADWKIKLQEEKVDFLESIIKSLSTRGYQIKAAVDWVKFTQGA
jgi:hypothetical protein